MVGFDVVQDYRNKTTTQFILCNLPDPWSCFQCTCGVIVVNKMKNVYQKKNLSLTYNVVHKYIEQ